MYKNPEFAPKMCVYIYIYTHTNHDSWQAQLNNVQFLRFMPFLLWVPYIQPGPALEEVRHLTLIGSSNYFEVLGSWNLLLIDQQVPYIWESQQQEHWKCLQQLEQLGYYRCKCLIFQYRLQSLAGLWVRKKWHYCRGLRFKLSLHSQKRRS